MAYVETIETSTDGTYVTSVTATLPAHDENDLLLVHVTHDQNCTFSESGATWTKETEATTASRPTSALFSKVAGASEANPTFNSTGGSRDMLYTVVVVKGAPTSSAIDVSASNGTSGGPSQLSPSVTTTVDNCLILEFCTGGDDINPWFALPETRQIGLGSNSLHLTHCVTQSYQMTAGATTQHRFINARVSDDAVVITVAIKDSGGNIKGCVDPSSSPATCINPLLGANGGTYNNDPTENISDPTTFLTTVNGNTTQYRSSVNYKGVGSKIDGQGSSWGFSITSSTAYDRPIVSQRRLAAPVDLSNSIIGLSSIGDSDIGDYATTGKFFGIGNGDNSGQCTGIRLYQYESRDSSVRTDTGISPFIVDTSQSGWEDVGTVDLTASLRIIMGEYALGFTQDGIGYLYKYNTMKLIGGSVTFPCSFGVGSLHGRTGALRTVRDQNGAAKGQFFASQDLQIGNGSDATYWDSSNQSLEYPAAYDEAAREVSINVAQGAFTLTLLASAADTVNLTSTTLNMGDLHNFTIDASTSSSATYDFTGLSLLNGDLILNDIGSTVDGVVISGCKEINYTTLLDLSGGNTISNCVDTQAITVTSETDFAKLANCTFSNNDVAGACAIKITGNQAGSWSDPNLTVSGNTYDIEYTGTTDFEIQSATPLTVNNSSSGTLTIATPVQAFQIDSSEASSLIQIFTTGTQTVLDSTTGASLNYPYTGTVVVDYVVQKAGFLPQRFTGVTLTNSTASVVLADDPVYDSGHGLTYTTDFSYNRSTKELTLATRQEGRDFYSALIDAFIAQTTLRNTAFDFKAVGPDSIFFLDDAEIIDSSSEDNWKGAGIRYLTSSDVVAAEWVSIKSAGTIPSGATGEYQQIDGSSTTDLRATGAVDQIIKVYGDSTHGNFDYRGHLVVKYQVNGYREVRADVLDLAGVAALEPFEYSIAMEPVAINAATGDPAVTITVTDHGASPVTWNSKDWSITVLDSGAVTGEEILRELNYNLSLGTGSYQGKDHFNWPEMVVEAGSAYESLQGVTEGGAGAALKGVRVLRGSDPHPDFTRMQADDGTYYTVPVTANGSITGIVSGSRVRIYNETTATETYNDVPGTSYAVSYTDGTTYSSGDVVKIYVTQTSGTTAQLPFSTTTVASSTGWTALVEQESDTVYDSYGLNGSAITKFTADYVNDEVDLIVSSNFSAAEFYAWWCYNLTTSQGISDFFGGITAQDAANLRINNDVISMYLDNTTTTNVYQTDNIRIYRTDQAYPVKNPTSGGGGIDVVWRDRVYIAETGVSGLTASESTQLFAASTFNPAVDVVEGSETWQESMRLVRAEAAGKVAVSGNTVTFRDAADSTDRIVATVDEQGQRTAITTDVS